MSSAVVSPPTIDWKALMGAYRSVRRASVALAEGLSPEDTTSQSMTDASPVKWHLAHTSWFFETFVLASADGAYRPFDERFRYLFNSYYNTVGDQYPRPRRGLVTRPGLEEILAYRRHVDDGMGRLLAREALADSALAGIIEIGLHHEQQHQELILTDLKHLFSFNPLHPVYRRTPQPDRVDCGEQRWHRFREGLREIGHDGASFAFDNERPRHRVFLEAYQLASRPVTNAEFIEFIEDGGYRTPELWLSDGWFAVRREGWEAPLYWETVDGQWHSFTLGGLRPLRLDEPVCHVSYYEAEAYATWAGARLPTEAEWEHAATGTARSGNFVEDGFLHPVPVGASPEAPQHLLGNLWEWTQSAYLPYPGYRPPEGALGEYNGKFMCNQMVLRGGSCATPRSHVRPTYRNFFYPYARWQFSGIRLART
ncbi:MAG: ergothioneine biosynthesis protein EgtB [Chromatiales bacterium]|jgi:ergothioneine biosynthesis protein EgtB